MKNTVAPIIGGFVQAMWALTHKSGQPPVRLEEQLSIAALAHKPSFVNMRAELEDIKGKKAMALKLLFENRDKAIQVA